MARSGSNSCRTTPKANSRSSSPPRAASTWSPASPAAARTSVSRRVLPIPALPSIATRRPSPSRAAATIAASVATSVSRSKSNPAPGAVICAVWEIDRPSLLMIDARPSIVCRPEQRCRGVTGVASVANRPSARAQSAHRTDYGKEPSMSPLKPSYSLAARMGRWSASHWKTAVFGWLAFVIAAVAVGQVVGQKTASMEDANVGEARKADQILKQAGLQPVPQTEIVLIQSKRLTIEDAAFRSTVADVVRTVRPFTTIANLRSPLDPGRADQISKDGRTVLVQWEMRGDQKVARKNVDALAAATAKVAKAHPGFYVGQAGWASSGKAFDKLFTDQLKQAGERSVPLTLAVLIVVFGALVAAGLPLLLALTAVIASIGLIALPCQLVPMDGNVGAVVLLVGLAVGVDYALFYLKREREERAAGKGPRAALEAAAATSGRAVLISGVTVMIAMAGMLFTGDKTYLSLGVSTMIVVAAAML